MVAVRVSRLARRIRAVAGVALLLNLGTVSADTPVAPAEGGKAVLGEGGAATAPAEPTTPAPCCAPSLSGASNVLTGTCGTGGCGEGGCYPGRAACNTCCEGMGPVRRLFCNFQNALLCPDPCYQSKWIPVANAGLFLDQARPTTMTRLRWDAGRNVTTPDRSDFFLGSGAFWGLNQAVSSVTFLATATAQYLTDGVAGSTIAVAAGATLRVGDFRMGSSTGTQLRLKSTVPV